MCHATSKHIYIDLLLSCMTARCIYSKHLWQKDLFGNEPRQIFISFGKNLLCCMTKSNTQNINLYALYCMVVSIERLDSGITHTNRTDIAMQWLIAGNNNNKYIQNQQVIYGDSSKNVQWDRCSCA